MTNFAQQSRCRFLPLLVGLALIGLVAAGPRDDPRTKKTPKKIGLLLLNGGRVITGQVTHGAGEYQVRRANGELFVPERMVRFECRDLKDAYQKQREALPSGSAAQHMMLGRWCLSHNLLREARVEMRQALELEPSRLEARRTLRKIDAVVDPADSSGPSRLSHNGLKESLFFASAESLSGLSRETGRQFTRRIQPILFNNCGNAGCHGQESQSDFRLKRVSARRNFSRSTVERNLAAVLKQLNFKQPDDSQLLRVPVGNHGGSRRPVLGGRRGREQRKALREWVKRVGRERSPGSKSADDKRTLKSRVPTREEDPIRAPPELVKETDAFDPDEFNRQSGGRRR